MKGGGNGGSHKKYTRAIGPGGGRGGDDCAALNFDAELVRIQAGLAAVPVGNYMSIQLAGKTLTAYNDAGVACGNISSAFNGKLIECSSKGFIYRAKLLNTSGAIHVEPEP